MKIEIVPRKRTKDRKQARIIVSMTESEARGVAMDILAFRRLSKKKETMASWSLARQLKDYFDGQDPVVPMTDIRSIDG